MAKSSSNPYYDQAKMQTIAFLLCNRLDEVFEALEVKLHKTSRLYYGCCPIHGGDNPNALSLYKKGDVPGKWVCRTHHCEDVFKKTIIGFVRGMLSQNKYGWNKPGNKTATFHEGVDWCCNFLGQSLTSLKVDVVDLEKRSFANTVSLVSNKREKHHGGITRDIVRARLQIPADYFQKRGWSREVLDRYDVGFCGDVSKEFFGRVVTPIYNDDYTYVVGCTGRSIYEKCGKCRLHHAEGMCPAESDAPRFSKWRNSKGFAREQHLYNYWFAKKHILKDGVAVLVEGPGDLWRLVEAGIPCGVAMFGDRLTEQQQITLEMSGAMSIVVLTNMDEAGRLGAAKIKNELSRSFRVEVPEYPGNDLGETSSANLRKWLLPFIERLKR